VERRIVATTYSHSATRDGRRLLHRPPPVHSMGR